MPSLFNTQYAYDDEKPFHEILQEPVRTRDKGYRLNNGAAAKKFPNGQPLTSR